MVFGRNANAFYYKAEGNTPEECVNVLGYLLKQKFTYNPADGAIYGEAHNGLACGVIFKVGLRG